MAHFYGTIQGNRGEATRMGSVQSGFEAIAASWEGGVKTTLYREGETDKARVELIPWQGKGTNAIIYDGPVGIYKPAKK